MKYILHLDIRKENENDAYHILYTEKSLKKYCSQYTEDISIPGAAELKLAQMYKSGAHITPHQKDAFYWLKQSASLGNIDAIRILNNNN